MTAPTYGSRDAGVQQPSVVDSETGDHIHKRISWSALIAGAVVAVAVHALLTLLGAGIGFSAVDVATSATPTVQSFGLGTGIWWVLSSCIALFVGGYVAAWLAGIEIAFDGMMHGLVTWGVFTLATIWLLASAVGGVANAGVSSLSSVTSAAGSGVAQAVAPVAQAAGVSPDMLQQQAQAYLQPMNPDPAAMSPQDAQKAIASELSTYAMGGAQANGAKDRIIAISAAQMKTSPDEAREQFDAAQAKLTATKDDAMRKAKVAADKSASAAAMTSFAAFAISLLGLVAAGFGGSLAVQRRARRADRIVAA